MKPDTGMSPGDPGNLADPLRHATLGAIGIVHQTDQRGKFSIMPTISLFYGIVIYLYFYDDERH
ncbi:MAG: hypothetical protein MZV65_32680 [Chromatiales bacterium]|nr:hypothetical protein [Chromatiales bacterium]